jgi:hypothetical protein
MDNKSQDSDTPQKADCSSAPCSLWRYDYGDENPRGIKSADLFVWVCVNTLTGQVDTSEPRGSGDDLDGNLIEGWEWRRFRLIEANS